MHFYHLYGLNFQSTFTIQGLIEIAPPQANPDVTIQLVSDGCIDDFVPEDVAQQPIALQLERTDALVYLQNSGVYLIQGGCKIVIISRPGVLLETMCQTLLGVVLAVLLYQRGLYILHASTAAMGDTALAFLGDSGAGKSSALASVIGQGFSGVTDDLSAIQLSAEGAVVYPGVPKMKLSTEVASTLMPGESTPPTQDETSFSFVPPNTAHALPLQHLYILDYGPDFAIEPIPRQRAIIELLRYSGLKSVLPARSRYQFNQAAQLAKCVRLYRLRRPHSLLQLPKMAQLLRHHINHTHFGQDDLEYEVIK